MIGKNNERGIYVLAAADIFKKLTNKQEIWISFFEIYKGKLYDLLNSRKSLFAREDNMNMVNIVGLKEQKVKTVKELLKFLDEGNGVRSCGQTGANSESSRSHAILQISLKWSENSKNLVRKFSFIDLAGSERGVDTFDNNKKTR
jgi:kinesin family member 2/24